MTAHKNRLETNFVLTLDLPLARQRFYSESLINNDDLAALITTILPQYQKTASLIFDCETMRVHVDGKKTLTFCVQKEISMADEFSEVEKTVLLNGIKTQIIMDVQRSIPGTEICVDLAKALQQHYPRSLFVDDVGVFIGGHDVQNIKIAKNWLYEMRDIFEKLE